MRRYVAIGRDSAHVSVQLCVIKVQRPGEAVDHTGQTARLPSSPLPSNRDTNVRRAARKSHGRVTPPSGATKASLFRMHKRKLLIGLATAGLFLAGFSAATMPASAEQRTLLVTLLGGAQVTVTVDVPPGTPVDQIKIPGVTTPIVAVQDITPQQQPAPTTTQPPAQVQVDPNGQKPSQPSSGSKSSDNGGSSNAPTQQPQAGQQAQQQTTGKVGKPEAPVEAAKKAAE